jgi:hypothetical protein
MALTKVSSSLVSDSAVTSGKIADGGIATVDIADVAVTSAKIANNAILTQHIDDAQVTTDQLGADAVTAAKIADDAISEEHLDITVITSLTAVTAATGDLLMVADVSDSNNLKKIPVSSILAGTHTGGSSGTHTGAVNTSGTIQGARLGLGVAPHGTAGLSITTTDQHIRLNNGSELGIISLDSNGILDIWAHGDGESLTLRTGTGSGTAALTIAGVNTTFAGTISSGNISITKEDPFITLTDSSSSRTLMIFNDNNNSVIRASGPLLLQVGSQSAITVDASRNATFAGTVNATGGTLTGTLNGVAANFSSDVRISGWLTGASDTNTLYSGNNTGTIIQTPSNTNNAAGSFYIRDSLGSVHFTLNTNTNAVDIVGTITSSGAVTTPSTDVQQFRILQGTATAGGIFKERTITGSGVSNDVSIFAESITDGGEIHFMTGGSATKRVTIDSSGKVGINDTDPSQILSVSGTSSTPPARFTATGNTNTLEVWGNATASTSTGILCNAGTNSNDYSAKFRNYAGSTIMEVRGDSLIDTFGGIRLQDSNILALGQSSDTRLYYDGTDSLYITAVHGTANAIKTSANNTYIMQANGNQLITAIANSEVIINNDSSASVDFRVESDNEQYNFFCDASSEIIHFGEGTNSDVQAVIPAKTLAGRRHGYHGGNKQHAGQTFKYSESTGWTDAIKIDWNNDSWGAVCMRITGQYYYGASNNFSIVIGFQGHAANGSISYDATSSGVETWTNAIQLAQSATGETMIRQRAGDTTGDIIYRYEWQCYARSNQSILIIEQ